MGGAAGGLPDRPGTGRAGANGLGPVQRDRGQRRNRACAVGDGRRRAAPSGEPRQADDALHAVRGAARPSRDTRRSDAGLGARRRDGAGEALCPPRQHADGAPGGARDGDALGQRRRRGARRVSRRHGGPIRADDDAAGPFARDARHHFPQRLRPARSRDVDHGARHGDAGGPPDPRLPGLLSLFLDAAFRVPRPRDPEPRTPSCAPIRG